MDNSIPSWDQYFLNIAQVVSTRSKDDSTKVGCVIIDKEKRILATGYNGFPPGFPDIPELWEKPTKYSYVCHAEAAAIAYGGKDLREATLYVTLHPCNECAKLIASSGIKEVVYSQYRDEYETSRQILNMSGVTLRQIEESNHE